MGEKVGIKLKALRNAKKITLKELGEATGLSVSYLSQVERGVSSINLDSLERIAHALGMPIDHLLDLPSQRVERCVIRTHEQKIDVAQNTSCFCHRLCNETLENAYMEPRIVNVLPGMRVDRSALSVRTGEEFFYVLEGTVTFSIDGQQFALGPGDSAHCDGRTRFEWENPTKRMVRLLFVGAEQGGLR